MCCDPENVLHETYLPDFDYSFGGTDDSPSTTDSALNQYRGESGNYVLSGETATNTPGLVSDSQDKNSINNPGQNNDEGYGTADPKLAHEVTTGEKVRN